MKRIKYAGSEFLTGDEIARALLDYSAALAGAGAAEAFEVPVIHTDGSRAIATVLAGPASQIVAEDEHTHLEELIDQDAVDRLETRTRQLRPVASTSDDSAASGWDQEY